MNKQRKRCSRCGDTIVAEGSLCSICQEWDGPEDHPGLDAAACPFCGSVYLDSSQAGRCCRQQRQEVVEARARAFEEIRSMSLDDLIEALEARGFACFEHETVEQLREALVLDMLEGEELL